ncbi:hypothetical protein M0R72_00540 [Candidatus Pacearchaeota archaeon]|jgi:hypothetical protein|nr:hypothetical protein [Candidatus Pacearchaeota archaeon]
MVDVKKISYDLDTGKVRLCVAISTIVTAFDRVTIGTKVVNAGRFMDCVTLAMLGHDFGAERIPGQALIHVPKAVPFVSGGMGRNRNNPNDYVLCSYRGKVHAYLKREFAEPVTNCHVVVYTRDAYLADPDIDEDPAEAERIRSQVYDTHILVAVLAASGVPSRLSPYRFVKNLAGGNHEALAWSGDEIRTKAREIAADVDEWSIVADYQKPTEWVLDSREGWVAR